MNFDRLENLIVALQGADPENFTMDDYVNHCGTPACVLGHYAARTDLQTAFTLDRTHGWVQTVEGQSVSWAHDAVCDHFGIDGHGACALFSGAGCGCAETPAEAIDYIRAFIDENKAVTP